MGMGRVVGRSKREREKERKRERERERERVIVGLDTKLS